MWYKEGLPFKCTGCGGCCTGSPGYVFLSIEEMEKIAAFLKLSLDEFTKKYVRQVQDGRYSLIEDQKTFDCVFLKGKRCEIYPVRPSQCASYPFWPSVLKSKESWDAESSFCEGINHKDAEVVPFEKIQLIKIGR